MLKLSSPAKVNLYLEILKKRKDQYHSLKTVFERLDLADTIVLKERKDAEVRVICSDKAVPKDSSNLCSRSAKILQDKFKVSKGVDIRIIKRIPVGAGLGGGSGNAATTLLGLNRLWQLRLNRKTLMSLGRRIGSDVAFFLSEQHFALGSGRGEFIQPLKSLNQLKLWHVLVVPRIHVSTPLIYAKWDEFRGKNKEKAGLTKPLLNVKILILALKRKNLPLIGAGLYNNLEIATLRLFPEVSKIKAELNKLGLKAILMSGSGPAVFALCSSRKEAELARSKLRKTNGSWRVFVAKTL